MKISNHLSSSNRRRSNLNQRGFTLFELIIAIAVVGLMVGLVISRVDDMFDVNIKKATSKLSSTIRYLHDKASTQNLYIRMIFDFEKNSYWVEATTEQFMLTTKKIKEELDKELEGAPEEEDEIEAESVMDDENKEEGEKEKIQLVKRFREPEFGAVDEFLLKPVKLPDGIIIKDVYTSHDDGPVSGGQAFIYFFPNGYVEPAVINLSDDDGELNYSIEINPVIGSTRLRSEYRTLEQGEEK